MTINSQNNKTIALGNGSQTQFAFGFVGVAAAYIGVIFTDGSGNETVLSQGAGATQYQIVLNPAVPGALWGIGGTVTYDPLSTPIANGTSLTIFRTLPLTQAVSLQNQISLSELGNGAETGLDTLEMQLQQISENIARAITAPIVDPSTINLILPPAAQRANTGLAFDGSGNVIAGTTPATGLISSAMQPVVDAATLALGRTAFGLGTMATEGIGSGLIDDGAGKARVNNPITQVATNQAVTAAFDLERFIATGPINFTFPRVNTLWNGFGFWVEAVVGDVTFVIDSHDQFAGNPASGTSFTVPAGASVFVTTDSAASGQLYVEGLSWLTQNARSCSGTYNISASDHTKILKHNSGAFGTFIFPAAATLRSDFRCLIVNGETTPIGKGVGGTDQGSFRLYPGQAYLVINDSGTMRVVGGLQPYEFSSVALFNDQTAGNDSPLITDGLGAVARALKTQNASRQQLYRDFNHLGSQPSVTLNGIYPESITFAGMPINCGVFFWGGASPGSYISQPTNSGSPFCWIIGDGATMETQNTKWDGNGLNATGVQMHQDVILDVLGGCEMGAFGTGSHFASDGAGWTLNIDASYKVSGGATNHIGMIGAGVINHAGGVTVTITGTPTISGSWFNGTGAVLFALGPTITWSGSVGGSGHKWVMGPQAAISLSGNAANVPGGAAGLPATGSVPTASTGWATA